MSFIDSSSYLTNATKGSSTSIGEPGIYIGIIEKIESDQYFLTIPKLSPFTIYGPCRLFASAPTVGSYVVVTFLDNRFDEPVIISTDISYISSSEFTYLDGVTSSLQTQLNSKAPIANPTITGTLTAGDVSVTGLLSIQEVSETVTTASVASNIVTCSLTSGAIFYTSATFTNNFTVAVTNVPTTNARAITFTLVVLQGATGRIPTSLTINGSGSTIRWAQNTTPTASPSSYDIFSFTLFRPSSTWITFANANTGFSSV